MLKKHMLPHKQIHIKQQLSKNLLEFINIKFTSLIQKIEHFHSSYTAHTKEWHQSQSLDNLIIIAYKTDMQFYKHIFKLITDTEDIIQAFPLPYSFNPYKNHHNILFNTIRNFLDNISLYKFSKDEQSNFQAINHNIKLSTKCAKILKDDFYITFYFIKHQLWHHIDQLIQTEPQIFENSVIIAKENSEKICLISTILTIRYGDIDKLQYNILLKLQQRVIQFYYENKLYNKIHYKFTPHAAIFIEYLVQRQSLLSNDNDAFKNIKSNLFYYILILNTIIEQDSIYFMKDNCCFLKSSVHLDNKNQVSLYTFFVCSGYKIEKLGEKLDNTFERKYFNESINDLTIDSKYLKFHHHQLAACHPAILIRELYSSIFNDEGNIHKEVILILQHIESQIQLCSQLTNKYDIIRNLKIMRNNQEYELISIVYIDYCNLKNSAINNEKLNNLFENIIQNLLINCIEIQNFLHTETFLHMCILKDKRYLQIILEKFYQNRQCITQNSAIKKSGLFKSLQQKIIPNLLMYSNQRNQNTHAVQELASFTHNNIKRLVECAINLLWQSTLKCDKQYLDIISMIASMIRAQQNDNEKIEEMYDVLDCHIQAYSRMPNDFQIRYEDNCQFRVITSCIQPNSYIKIFNWFYECHIFFTTTINENRNLEDLIKFFNTNHKEKIELLLVYLSSIQYDTQITKIDNIQRILHHVIKIHKDIHGEINDLQSDLWNSIYMLDVNRKQLLLEFLLQNNFFLVQNNFLLYHKYFNTLYASCAFIKRELIQNNITNVLKIMHFTIHNLSQYIIAQPSDRMYIQFYVVDQTLLIATTLNISEAVQSVLYEYSTHFINYMQFQEKELQYRSSIYNTKLVNHVELSLIAIIMQHMQSSMIKHEAFATSTQNIITTLLTYGYPIEILEKYCCQYTKNNAHTIHYIKEMIKIQIKQFISSHSATFLAIPYINELIDVTKGTYSIHNLIEVYKKSYEFFQQHQQTKFHQITINQSILVISQIFQSADLLQRFQNLRYFTIDNNVQFIDESLIYHILTKIDDNATRDYYTKQFDCVKIQYSQYFDYKKRNFKSIQSTHTNVSQKLITYFKTLSATGAFIGFNNIQLKDFAFYTAERFLNKVVQYSQNSKWLQQNTQLLQLEDCDIQSKQEDDSFTFIDCFIIKESIYDFMQVLFKECTTNVLDIEQHKIFAILERLGITDTLLNSTINNIVNNTMQNEDLITIVDTFNVIVMSFNTLRKRDIATLNRNTYIENIDEYIKTLTTYITMTARNKHNIQYENTQEMFLLKISIAANVFFASQETYISV